MGGKKKTKWRKLPLEEFTKEIQTETDIPTKVPPENEYQPDPTSEESMYDPSFSEAAENVQYYTEPYEYIDGLYYPTSCVVYNPADVGMYPNYMMPVDTCYYYYTVPPEMPQMQEYVPMSYQEYAPPLPKDTVYLLLPTQSLRPSQAASNTVPEWQHRRQQRRYEGYADYAIIPEKTSSTTFEETDSKRGVHYVNSRRNSNQSNNFKKMTSFPESSNFENHTSVSERYQGHSKSSDAKKSSISFPNLNKERGLNFATKEMNSDIENTQKHKKSLEVCGIHTKSIGEKKETETTKEKDKQTTIYKNEDTLHAEKSYTEESSVSQLSQNSDAGHISQDNLDLESKQAKKITKEQSNKIDHRSLTTKHELHTSTVNDLELNTELEHNFIPNEKLLSFHEDKFITNSFKKDEDMHETSTHSSLPDILSTLNKPTVNSKVKDNDDILSIASPDSRYPDKGINTKAKSLLSQTSYLPNLLSSEAFHNEMEMELQHLQNLHSLQANQSIYKLAFDENVTDQSEVDSRSPSPIDPESQVPSSLTNDEILIHEADSGSEAGSEDVELIPHRYESETFLNKNKHMYVNKLSLAVELLRTQENLPYDDEFKRVVGETNSTNNIVPVHTRGKMNLGFTDDSSSRNTYGITKDMENKDAAASTNINLSEIITKRQMKHSAHSSNDSAIFSDIEFDNLDEEESCETAKEVETQVNGNQENTDGIRAGYRRFGVQARHYFSPRAALPLNPCFCCIIM